MCKIANVKRRIDAKVYYSSEGIILKRHTGQGWYQTASLCPFHNDRKPNTLYVNAHTSKFNCYSCGSRGDVIDFHIGKHGLTMKQALKDLGGRSYEY